MAVTVGTLQAILEAKIDGFKTQFNQASASVKTFSDNASKNLRSASDAIKKYKTELTAVSVVTTAAITASVLAFNKLDDALDDVAIKTGESGEALEGLQDIVKELATTVPNSFEEIGVAVSELRVRLGLTGKELENTSKSALTYARINKVTVSESIRTAGQIINAYQLSASQLPLIFDKLTLASQKTGVNVQSLSQNLLDSRIALSEMGFSLEQQIALLGQLEKAGLEPINVISALNIGLRQLAAQGATDAKAAMLDLIERIKNAPTLLQGVSIATETFGRQSGLMAAAIRNGTFNLDDLTEKLDKAGGSLDAAADKTDGAKEAIAKMQNAIIIAAAEIGAQFEPIITSAAEKVSDLAKTFAGFPQPLKTVIAAILGLGAAVSTGLLIFGKLAGSTANLIDLYRKLPANVQATTGRFGLLAAKLGVAIILTYALQKALEAVSSESVEASKKTGELSQAMATAAFFSNTLRNVLTLNFEEIGKSFSALTNLFAQGVANWALYWTTVANTIISNQLKIAKGFNGLLQAIGVDNPLSNGAVRFIESLKASTVSLGLDLISTSNKLDQEFKLNVKSVIEGNGGISTSFTSATLAATGLNETASNLANTLDRTGSNATGAGESTKTATDKLKDAKEAVDKLNESFKQMNELVLDSQRRLRGELSGIARDIEQNVDSVTDALNRAINIRNEARSSLITAFQSDDAETRRAAAIAFEATDKQFEQLAGQASQEIQQTSSRLTEERVKSFEEQSEALRLELQRSAEERAALDAELDGNIADARTKRQELEFNRELDQLKANDAKLLEERQKELDSTVKLIGEREAVLKTLQDSVPAGQTADEGTQALINAAQQSIDALTKTRTEQQRIIEETEKQHQERLTSIMADQELKREQLRADIRAQGIQISLKAELNRIETQKQAELTALRETGLKLEDNDVNRARMAEQVAVIEAKYEEQRSAVVNATIAQIGENERGLQELRESLGEEQVKTEQNIAGIRIALSTATNARIISETRKALEEQRQIREENLDRIEETERATLDASKIREAGLTTDIARRYETQRQLDEKITLARNKATAIESERLKLETQYNSASALDKAEIEKELTRIKQQEESAKLELTRARVESEVNIERQRAADVAEIFEGQFFKIENDSIKFSADLGSIWNNFKNQQQKIFVDMANESIRQMFLMRDASATAANESQAAWAGANAGIVESSQGAASNIFGIFGSLISNIKNAFGSIGSVLSGGGLLSFGGGGKGGSTGGLGGILGSIGGLVGKIGSFIGPIAAVGGLVGSLFSKRKDTSVPISQLISATTTSSAVMQQAAEQIAGKVSTSLATSRAITGSGPSVVQSISVPISITVEAKGLDEVAARVKSEIPEAVKKTVDELRRLDRLVERGLPRRIS